MFVRRTWTRAINYYKRESARCLYRRRLTINLLHPLISFTFDDFPRSALTTGGAILNRYGLAGTYYTALSLAGTDGPSGPLYQLHDLKTVLADGHELGCHTFAHCHSWDTSSEHFLGSILENQAALTKLIPEAEFQSFSYPMAEPRPGTKRRMAKHFLACRGGGQAINIGTADLNQLSAFFLEKSRDSIQVVKDLIEDNRERRGWLIFATHDVGPNPSPYGCTPEFFEEVVRTCINSGAEILPVVKALETARQAVKVELRVGKVNASVVSPRGQ